MNSNLKVGAGGLLASCQNCGQRNRLAFERLAETFRCGKCHAELRASEPVEVKSESEFEELTGRSAVPVLVDFWASWCGPCKMLAPELLKVAAEGASRWLVTKVNTEELPGIAQRFRVMSLPTLALFIRGRESARQSGAMPAHLILQFIRQTVKP